jgi:DnaK suppressor protein
MQELNMTDSTRRNADLSQLLRERRREMQDDVQSRIRSGRTDRPIEVGDVLDYSDGDIQDDIELALLQMRAATLIRIEEALVRLDAGKYGSCFECGGEISEQRLRALPFAVRCRACEERREQEQRHARQLDQRRESTLFPEVVRT